MELNSYLQEIDLLIKGGHVIDSKNKLNNKLDVASSEHEFTIDSVLIFKFSSPGHLL